MWKIQRITTSWRTRTYNKLIIITVKWVRDLEAGFLNIWSTKSLINIAVCVCFCCELWHLISFTTSVRFGNFDWSSQGRRIGIFSIWWRALGPQQTGDYNVIFMVCKQSMRCPQVFVVFCLFAVSFYDLCMYSYVFKCVCVRVLTESANLWQYVVAGTRGSMLNPKPVFAWTLFVCGNVSNNSGIPWNNSRSLIRHRRTPARPGHVCIVNIHLMGLLIMNMFPHMSILNCFQSQNNNRQLYRSKFDSFFWFNS